MKKIGLIIILVISLIGVVFGITYLGFLKDNNGVMHKITSESKVISYKKSNYQVIPSDMLEKHTEYVDILEGLNLDYKVDVDDVGLELRDLEEGGSLYMTKYQDDRVLILKDYNNEYVYAFKIQ